MVLAFPASHNFILRVYSPVTPTVFLVSQFISIQNQSSQCRSQVHRHWELSSDASGQKPGGECGEHRAFCCSFRILRVGFRAFGRHDALRYQKNLSHFYFITLDSHDYGSGGHRYLIPYDAGRQYGNHQLPLTFCGGTPNELAE